MQYTTQQDLFSMARAVCASARIIEAHTNARDQIAKVVIELGDSVQHWPLREAIVQLWHRHGFITSVSKEGLLTIDGLRNETAINEWDLLGAVNHQLKNFTKASMQQEARRAMAGHSVEEEVALKSGYWQAPSPTGEPLLN